MKVGGQILWNVTPICETSQIYYLMWRRPMKDVLGNLLKGPIVPIGSLVEYHLKNCEGPIQNPSIWKESFTWIVPRICTRSEFGKVMHWSQTLRSWKRWTHRKSTRKKRLNAKEVIFPKQGEDDFFPNRRWTNRKPLGGDQDLRTSTLVRPRPIQGEGHVDILGESEGSLPQPQDSFPDAGEAINDFWSMSGNFTYRHYVEPRVKLYSKYIDVTRTTHTNLDVKQEKRIDDYWNIDGSRDLSNF